LFDESLVTFALEVLEKGGPLAFAVIVIVGAYLKFGRLPATGTESQMTAALKSLEERVRLNHEASAAHREELKDGMSDLGQRVARIEGRMEAAETWRR